MRRRFAANVGFLWPELALSERVEQAAQAGFEFVEMGFIDDVDVHRLSSDLQRSGQALILFDGAPGDPGAGELGLLGLPGREDDFRRGFQRSLSLALELGVGMMNLLAGVRPTTATLDETMQTLAANLRYAAALAEPVGIQLLMEPINSVDVPGYLLDTVDKAVRVVNSVAHPNVWLEVDCYHIAMMGGDPVSAIRQYCPLIKHVQIADVPGRHEPGTGQIPIDGFLATLDELGFDGMVGLEYAPKGSTAAGLSWMARMGVSP